MNDMATAMLNDGACAKKASRRTGFTLIELLVVISIIALLIGILLPALGAARKSAFTAVCLGHLRNAGQGLAVYVSENKGWLAGPNTSGGHIVAGFANWGESPLEPVQNNDWISPTLGDSLGLPRDRIERLIAIFETEMRCPANSENYGGQYTGLPGPAVPVDPTSLRANSYSAAVFFHTVPPGKGVFPNPFNGVFELPANYGPKIERIGGASNKAYAMDGSRYVDRSIGQHTFNTANGDSRGGNFMNTGPGMSRNSEPFWLEDMAAFRPDEWSLRKGYLHQESTNIVFYDGHGDTRAPREAVEVALWAPSGTIIKDIVPDPDATLFQPIR